MSQKTMGPRWNYVMTLPFAAVHVACLAVFWTGVTKASVILAVSLYVIRMFAVTGGYHRYFSHNAYKTSRVFQFFLAVLCQTSAQQGILWWAAKHREHHKFSDMPEDVHSPRQKGFMYSHVGWIFDKNHQQTNYEIIQNYARYPELVWLDKNKYLPAMVLGVLCWYFGGWPGLVVGFLISTVVLYHCTFFINSLTHMIGRQRYVTGDDSRNHFLLALLTLGEGWHNNHHYYQNSTRQGFFWWEVDITFYILKALSWTGLIWDLKPVPANVLAGEMRIPHAIRERVARQLADSFPLEEMKKKISATLAQKSSELDDLRERIQQGWTQALSEAHIPHIPTADEIKKRAHEMFAQSPSTDAIVIRARQMILQSVYPSLTRDLNPVGSTT